jgi:hypothetical protein
VGHDRWCVLIELIVFCIKLFKCVFCLRELNGQDKINPKVVNYHASIIYVNLFIKLPIVKFFLPANFFRELPRLFFIVLDIQFDIRLVSLVVW